jgi:GAF domain-containing protein
MRVPRKITIPLTQNHEMSSALPVDITDTLDEAVFVCQDLPQLLALVLSTALQLLGAAYGSLRWLDRRTNTLILEAVQHSAGRTLRPEDAQRLDLNGPSVVSQVARTKQPLLILDLSQGDWPQRYHPLDLLVPMRSELAVPLLSNDGKAVAGVLNVESPEPNAFTPQHVVSLKALAWRVRMAWQQSKLLEAIQTIGQKMVARDHDILLGYMVETLADLMYVPVCSVWLVDDVTEALVLKRATGRPGPGPGVSDIRAQISVGGGLA